MTSGKYKLQTILDLRERAKQERARIVTARRAALAEAEEELVRRERSLADCKAQQSDAQAQMLEAAGGAAEASRLVAHRTHLADLRLTEQQLTVEVDQQRLSVSRAEKEVEKALAALVEAYKELRVIEKHREGWRQQMGRTEARREQKLNDEIGLIRHKRK